MQNLDVSQGAFDVLARKHLVIAIVVVSILCNGVAILLKGVFSDPNGIQYATVLDIVDPVSQNVSRPILHYRLRL